MRRQFSFKAGVAALVAAVRRGRRIRIRNGTGVVAADTAQALNRLRACRWELMNATA